MTTRVPGGNPGECLGESERERERRFRVHEEAPGFRPGPVKVSQSPTDVELRESVSVVHDDAVTSRHHHVGAILGVAAQLEFESRIESSLSYFSFKR